MGCDAAISVPGINRNIVECKFIYNQGQQIQQIELIETLWNVNYINPFLQDCLKSELIETLWNVNVKLSVSDDGALEN